VCSSSLECLGCGGSGEVIYCCNVVCLVWVSVYCLVLCGFGLGMILWCIRWLVFRCVSLG